MTGKTLLIKGKGGLGNRMLSAVCGLVYADLTGRIPVIDWRDGSYAPIGENAYPLLFKSPINTGCDRFDGKVSGVSPAIWAGHLQRTPQDMIEKHFPGGHSDPRCYRKLCVDINCLAPPGDVAVFWSYLPKFGRLARLLKNDPRFVGRSEAEIICEYLERYFTPNVRIQYELGRYAASFGHPEIGVHVRHTDRKTPLRRLRAKLDQRLRRDPGARIFLATDSINVQIELQRQFPNLRVIAKYLDANEARLHDPGLGVSKLFEAENALIDMWLLSRCEHLIYSRHSTFSVTSSYLGRMRSTQLFDVDRYSPIIAAKRLVQRYA